MSLKYLYNGTLLKQTMYQNHSNDVLFQSTQCYGNTHDYNRLSVVCFLPLKIVVIVGIMGTEFKSIIQHHFMQRLTLVIKRFGMVMIVLQP